MSDIGDWFRSIPAITRYWFAATVAVPLVGKLGLISPAYFFLWPEAFLYRFQVLTGDGGSGNYRPQVAPQRRRPSPWKFLSPRVSSLAPPPTVSSP